MFITITAVYTDLSSHKTELQIDHVDCKRCKNVLIRELSICTTEGFWDSKISNVGAPYLLRLSIRVVELGGPTNDKYDACAHEWNWHHGTRIIPRANRKLDIKDYRAQEQSQQ